MPLKQLNETMFSAASSGKTTFSGSGDENGGNFSVATPVYSSGKNNGDYSVVIGGGRAGAWDSNAGSCYTMGAGISFKTW